MFFCFLMIMAYLSNPLTLCLYLIFMAAVLSVLMYSEISVWFFNALMLIFLGGMMILFLYLSTLSNNLKFIFPLLSLGSLTIISLSFVAIYNLNMSALGVKSELLLYYYSNAGSLKSPSILFFFMKIPHLIFIVTLLLLTLFTVMKLTESFKGSLVKSQKS